MAKQLTADDARQSLSAHVASKGTDIFEKYGPHIGWKELQKILEDRTCVRYPCTVEFNAGMLQPGEFACPLAKGAKPEDGYMLHVHPMFMTRLDKVPHLVFYHLVVVNYGEFASPDDAEIFGAAALGLEREDYYQILCEMSDLLGSASPACAC